MKTIKFLLAAGLLYATQVKSQYGQINYPHDSTVLSSAQLTIAKPGHVMAGYKGYNTPGSTKADFVIDKTDVAGLFSSASEFSASYEIWDNFNCSTSSRVGNCGGVSIIETQDLGSGEAFAITGVYNSGVFFATLDGNGNVIKTYRWNFPLVGGFYKKPAIRESNVNPGHYYICGDNNYDTYVFRINAVPATPVPVWSNWYKSWWLDAKDLIESPFNPNQLIVVGRTDVAFLYPGEADAFFMKLNANNGSVILAKHYNRMFDGDEWFSCIEPAFSPYGNGNGFILGGRSHFPFTPSCPCPRPTNVSYTQWMCKLDQNGNISWSKLIHPAANVANTLSGGEISDVYERQNPVSGQFEYYGVAEDNYIPNPSGNMMASKNLTVYKLDFSGNVSLTPDEFHYLKGSGTLNFGQLTAIETGGGPDDGIQAYGTNGTDHYFVKGYFNGVSGCNEVLTDIRRVNPGPDSVFNFNIQVSPFNANCQSSFSLVKNTISVSPFVYCSNTIVGGGSDNKMMSNSISSVNENSGISVFPNPVKDKTTVTYKVQENSSVKIEVFNALGQKINALISSNTNGKAEIDLGTINAAEGIYFVDITVDGVTNRTKIIYTK